MSVLTGILERRRKKAEDDISTLISLEVNRRMNEEKKYLREETQQAIGRIEGACLREIRMRVTDGIEEQLGDALNRLTQLTNENLTHMTKNLRFSEAMYAQFKALIEIIEPFTREDLKIVLEERAFVIRIMRAFAELEACDASKTHPAIINLYKQNIGGLYDEAQKLDWMHLYEQAVHNHRYGVESD